MVNTNIWKIVFTNRACEDALKISQIGLKIKVESLIEILKSNPYQNPPPFEKLVNVKNIYSRRINLQHRLVYEIRKKENIIIIRMMYKHYGR